MGMVLEEERQAIVDFGILMVRAGLTTGTGGNLSCCDRVRGLMAISPSGVPYGALKPRDVVVADLDGYIVDGDLKPSSEIGFHLALYHHRADIGGVVHTHSVYATTLACLHLELPPIHYLVGFAGYKVPVAPYATFGTDALAQNICQTMGADDNAVLLANHGLVTVGADLTHAFNIAEEIEFVARIFCQAKAIGEPVVLEDDEMKRVIQKFKTYGKQDDVCGR
jgi:L-fuculose-phosphate aldolase